MYRLLLKLNEERLAWKTVDEESRIFFMKGSLSTKLFQESYSSVAE